MAFDPDAYLGNSTPSSGGFNPDSYLSSNNFNPTTIGIKKNAENIEPGVYGSTDPTGQRILENLGTVASGYGVGKLGAMTANGIASIFQKAPTLMNAGIKAGTIAKMTPTGVNPADFGSQLEQKLVGAGAISGNPATSWDGMNNFVQNAGQRVGAARDAIASSPVGPDALKVDPEVALKPIYDAWGNEVNAIVPDGKTINTFGKYYSGLANVAKNNGGTLDLDDLHDFLQEVGPRTHTGTEAMQDVYSKIYSAGLNAQNAVANTVAQQANNPMLAKNLLDANSDYSMGMRLMPDVTKAAAAVPIKASVSTFDKLSPYLEKGAALNIGWQAAKKLIGQ